MNSLARLYIYAQWHIALCAALLYAGGCIVTGQPILQASLFLVLTSTQTIYNLHRLLSARRMQSDTRDRYVFMIENEQHAQISFVVTALISAILFLFVPLQTQIALVIAGLISLGYILPLVFNKRLRDIGIGKIFLISLVWALIPILSNLSIDQITPNTFLFLEHFFFIFALTIPFDIRDQDLDRKAKVSNLANELGLIKLSRIMVACIILASICALLLFMLSVYSTLVLVLHIVFYFFLFLVTKDLSRNHTEFYFIFFLDGLIALKGMIYFFSI